MRAWEEVVETDIYQNVWNKQMEINESQSKKQCHARYWAIETSGYKEMTDKRQLDSYTQTQT